MTCFYHLVRHLAAHASTLLTTLPFKPTTHVLLNIFAYCCSTGALDLDAVPAPLPAGLWTRPIIYPRSALAPDTALCVFWALFYDLYLCFVHTVTWVLILECYHLFRLCFQLSWRSFDIWNLFGYGFFWCFPGQFSWLILRCHIYLYPLLIYKNNLKL